MDPGRIWRALGDRVESGWAGSPASLSALLTVAGRLNAGIDAGRRLARYRRKSPETGEATVVSIMGVTWGGDGKTPLASHLARRIEERGYRVAIVCRSHGGRIRVASRVPAGPLSARLDAVRRWGDEAVMHASIVRDIPVWAGPDRSEALASCCLVDAPDVVVLDDGSGIEGLRPGLVVAVVRAGIESASVIPAGPLRPPGRGLEGADLVGILGREEATGPALEVALERLCIRDVPRFRFHLDVEPPDHPGPFLLTSAVARPRGVEDEVGRAGVAPRDVLHFPDHHITTARQRERLASRARRSGARAILVTQKDAPRWPTCVGALPVCVARARTVVHRGESVLERAIDRALGID